MSATFKRAAAFLIALCLSVGLFGQLVLADDIAETEEPAAEEVLEIEAESEDEDIIAVPEEAAIPESEDEEAVSVSEDETPDVTSEDTEDITEAAAEETTVEETVAEETTAEEVTTEEASSADDASAKKPVELLEDGWNDVDGGEVSEGYYWYTLGQTELWKVKYVPSDSGILTVFSDAGYDTYGFLYDSDNNLLKSDDDSGEGNNFKYTYSVEAGTTYYIGFRFYSSNDSGEIPIDISLTTVEEGWNETGAGEWFYVRNGEILYGWQEIDGYKYYFNYGSGIMLANTTTWEWDDDLNRSCSYRFDGSGHMVTGWYQVIGEWYYYDDNGRGAKGLTTLGGKQYYFRNDGYMYTGITVVDSENKKMVTVDSNGVVTSVTDVKNGWNQAGDEWYYFENGSAVSEWKEIGGFWYYFDWDGKMYHGTSFSAWDSSTGTYIYYRVDESGHMVTGWYQEGRSWYYYYSSGAAANGIQTVDGVKYCFLYNGRMLTNQDYNTGNSIIRVDGEGHVIGEIFADTDGWKQLGSDYYYVSQGSFVRGTMMDISGKTYYFNSEGVMLKNGVHFIYDPSIGNDNAYGFDGSGAMIKNDWLESLNNGGWYYFGSDGKALTGLQNIGGTQYYFDPDSRGRMAISCKFVEDNTFYVIDASGKATVYSGANGWVANNYYVENGKLVEDGWKNIAGYWYYFSDGVPYRNGYYMINDKNYYFDSSGAMKTGWIKFRDGRWLYAEGSGALKEDTWYQEGSTWYYFEGPLAVADIVKVDGQTYLFRSNATYIGNVTGSNKWVQNDKYWYYLKANGNYARNESVTVSGTKYYFDNNGRMLTNASGWSGETDIYYGADGKQAVSAWVERGERWQYYDENGIPVVEAWKKIGSSWYYFDESGYMVFGDRIIDNKLYHFSNGGVWDGKNGTALKKGWNLVSGDYYYFDGSSLYTGMHDIGGDTYYFSYDGKMVHDSIGMYSRIWTSSGAALKNGWYKGQYEQWYYADASGSMAEGLKTINGKQYYFSYGRMLTYGISLDNVYYDIGSDGVVKKTVTASGSKWTKVSNGWVYCKNGVFLNGMHKVDGAYYFFNDGLMLTDYTSYEYGYFGTDGKLVKTEGWVKDSYGDWYYLVNGSPVSGSRYIDGKWYYFSNSMYSGGWASDGIFFVDGSFYKYAGSSGGRTKLNFSEGWNQYGGNWYYVQDNYLVQNRVIKDGSKYYCFDYDGKMINGECTVYYYGVKYLQSNGTFLKNGWKKLNGTWYYFGPDGNALTGTWTIGGTTYHLTAPRAYYGGGGGKA